MRVFGDTGFWIALMDVRDEHHASAKEGFRGRLRTLEWCVSDFVVFETMTYLNCSLKRHDLAIRFFERIGASGIRVFAVDEETKARALEWFRTYADTPLSFTDCTSFVLMQREGLRHYAGFDRHFRGAGFVSLMEASS